MGVLSTRLTNHPVGGMPQVCGVDELGPVDYLVVEFPPGAELQRRDGGRAGPPVRRGNDTGAGPDDPAEVAAGPSTRTRSRRPTPRRVRAWRPSVRDPGRRESSTCRGDGARQRGRVPVWRTAGAPIASAARRSAASCRDRPDRDPATPHRSRPNCAEGLTCFDAPVGRRGVIGRRSPHRSRRRTGVAPTARRRVTAGRPWRPTRRPA